MSERFITYPTWRENTVKTADATPTTVATVAIPADTVMGVEAYVTGRRTDDGSEDGVFASLMFAFNNLAGTATIIGTATIDIKESDASCDVTVSASGADALIQVTGVAAADYDWTCRHTLYPVSEV